MQVGKITQNISFKQMEDMPQACYISVYAWICGSAPVFWGLVLSSGTFVFKYSLSLFSHKSIFDIYFNNGLIDRGQKISF